MAAIVDFEWDSRDLAVFRGRKIDAAIARALSKSGNDALRAMRAEASRTVRTKKRIKAGRLSRALPIVFPPNTKEIHQLVWRMNVSGAVMRVGDFPHRQVRKGVSVAINKGGRKLIRSAFVARMKSGHVGVFFRAKTGAHGPLTKKQQKSGHAFRVKRLPIEEIFTSRISDVFEDPGVSEHVLDRGRGVFALAFARLLPLELGKVK